MIKLNSIAQKSVDQNYEQGNMKSTSYSWISSIR